LKFFASFAALFANLAVKVFDFAQEQNTYTGKVRKEKATKDAKKFKFPQAGLPR